MKEKQDSQDLIETARLAAIFRIFIQAIEVVHLTENLKNSGPYTIFAPTDEAFMKVPMAKIHDLFKFENRETLQALLRSHIVIGEVDSGELKRLDEINSALGCPLRIESRAGLWINEAQITQPDLRASNGVIHAIDAVLIPQLQTAGAE